MDEVSSLITGELKNMARVEDLGRVGSKRKAIVTLFPYAVWRERCGDHRMVDAYLGIVKIPGSPVFLIDPIATLFGEANPDPPNRVVTLMSPYAEWGSQWFRGSEVTRWGAAALAVSYTEEIGQSVVDALLQIASVDNLQPYIPINIWAWLKKQPPLPPVCGGRSNGTRGNVVRRVRVLGDVEILESYFLLVWSEWNAVHREGFIEMRASIREDLGGIGMGRHREVLIKRLDYVLGRLDRGLGYLKQDDPNLDGDHIPTAKTQYGELRELLLGADEGALKVLTRMPFRLINLAQYTHSSGLRVHRIPLDVRLCPPSPISVVVCPRLPFLAPPAQYFICTRVPLFYPFRLATLRYRPLFVHMSVSSSHPSPHPSPMALFDQLYP